MAPVISAAGIPFVNTLPFVGRSCPVTILISVVLPAPDGPSNPKISPALICNVMPFNTSLSPNRCTISVSSIILSAFIMAPPSPYCPPSSHFLLLHTVRFHRVSSFSRLFAFIAFPPSPDCPLSSCFLSPSTAQAPLPFFYFPVFPGKRSQPH